VDPPPPDDFDPPSAEGEAYASDDEGDDGDEYCNQESSSNSPERHPKKPGRQPAHKDPHFPHENSMYQRLIDFGLSLIVPPRNPSPEQMRRHSASMSIAILGIYIHIAFACGWLATIGLSGFALASTVNDMQRENVDFRISFYSLGIREFHHSYCNASNYQDQLLLNNQLERLKAAYQHEVGVAYVLPPCPSK
jgi:hypothetical protein